MLLGPIGHVALFKIRLVAAGTHYGFLRNWRLKVGVGVPVEAHPKADFVCLVDIGRRHADGAVARMVVCVHHFLDDIYLAHDASVRQICPYPGLMVWLNRFTTAAF